MRRHHDQVGPALSGYPQDLGRGLATGDLEMHLDGRVRTVAERLSMELFHFPASLVDQVRMSAGELRRFVKKRVVDRQERQSDAPK